MISRKGQQVNHGHRVFALTESSAAARPGVGGKDFLVLSWSPRASASWTLNIDESMRPAEVVDSHFVGSGRIVPPRWPACEQEAG
jgi:hypothetical protein